MDRTKTLKLVVKAGRIQAIYDDEMIGLFPFNKVTVMRASHVEPQSRGGWSADLTPVGGPILKDFLTRKQALDAEAQYINQHVLGV